LGVGLLVVAYRKWLRTVNPVPAGPDPLADRWRYGLLGALALTSLVVALPVAYLMSTSMSGSTNITVLVVRYVISWTTVFAVTLAVASLWIARRHSPPAGPRELSTVDPKSSKKPSEHHLSL